MHVIVTFHLDCDDPKHPSGVSEATFVRVSNAVAGAGGYDIEFEKVEDSE